MKKCLHCNFENREGTFLCARCGTLLEGSDTATISTRAMSQAEFLPLNARETGTLGWSQLCRAALYLKETKTMFALEERRLTYILGRTSEANLADKDAGIDLTPFMGQLKGVSRVHAVLHRTASALTIVDMKSTNGTFINGKKLLPERAYALQNDDQITLGRLVLIFRLLETTKPKPK
jgi:FHA domain-containing protein